MDFLIRFGGVHETFRLVEIQALAIVENVKMEVVFYNSDSPFCIVKLDSPAAAAALISRSILSQSIHELWAAGDDYASLHADTKARSAHLWPAHETASWRFDVDSYRGARTQEAIVSIINSFAYLPLRGPIRMRGADTELTVMEHWADGAVPLGLEHPERLYLARKVASSPRNDLVRKYDLKKRRYISTTSMDSELALVTANIALAAPGRLFYDPFVGTGSFPVAAAQWGALAWGSDIDGRAVRGDEGGVGGKTLRGNFEQYGLLHGLADSFSADLTNSPVVRCPLGSGGGGRRWLDGIICDPPYGVREGLRVLGVRDAEKQAHVVKAGMDMYSLANAQPRDPDFIPPKRPYSFLAMLDDLLTFAAETLVDGGRLAFWMPTANDESLELAVPTHPCMRTVAVCVQVFNKWSRRLITYERIPENHVDSSALALALANRDARDGEQGTTADELNPFRRGYFTKFKTEET
ncbi:hypothetical protein PpBr36_07329 [Pyricularia pennisetigena]|uniref:hypothetical protein n=1 Tax=Pyricularia pennisetigena TaxID=1578925 RepID=UPI0011513428|nr:hypothetical protein PpBr36_07329 [Pyricularia pennisetigena]TLS25635.1 hypothetical protein PpBr36_07329 [Pyricularia pennisetigena]